VRESGTKDAGPGEGVALDPEVQRFVAEMSAAWASHPELAHASPAETRRIAELVRAPWTAGGPRMARAVERRLDTAAGPVRVRVYHPTDATIVPALVYLHGGGWTIFSLDTHDRLMREHAGRAGVAVVGVDYALSPEAKFPFALEQLLGVVRWLSSRGRELGVTSDRLAIGGDSAGANLSLAAAVSLRAPSSIPPLRGLLLNYGVFARDSSLEAIARYGGPRNMLTADEMEGFWHNYLRDERDAHDARACPLHAELAGLPPVRLVVPECDLLTEQSLRLAERLRDAGVETELALYEGATHSFLEAVSISSLADRALAESAHWLRRTLAA